ncbi:MAG: Asp-tRNA(Asn)/Glu-tRNA(Gln) amidotransferase subunit GatA [Patescibacteria group bacterium]
MDSLYLTIEEARRGLAEKKYSSHELIQASLDRISALNPKLNAFLTVTAETALAQADEIDAKRLRGDQLSPLAGLPLAVKDVLATRGVRTTAGSKILEQYIPPYTATAVQRLFDAGAIMVGKTNCDEFAMGSSGEWSAYGPTRNPWNTERVPGGSSSGSAAALASGMCLSALGTDTGSSVRQPAGFCNLVGLKPTYGRVSRYGLIAMASSLDQVGIFARTVEDSALILETIAGHDSLDSTSVSKTIFDLKESLKDVPKGLRLGIPKEYFIDGLDPAVETAIRKAIEDLRGLGFTIVDVSLPHTPDALAVYYLIMPAEASSNLARYDGIRYGLSLGDEAKDLIDIYRKTRAAGFGPEPKRRIILGTYVLSSGYYDKYYLKAQKVRSVIIQEYKDIFKTVDCLVTPTSPTVPFVIGERKEDPLQMYLADIFTVSANIVGLPAISIPAGFSDGLPIGLQLIGPHFQEHRLYQVARTYQAATSWHRQYPVG